MTPAQLAALTRYISAVARFMTSQGVGARELLEAKAGLEEAFGVQIPYPGEARRIAAKFPDIL